MATDSFFLSLLFSNIFSIFIVICFVTYWHIYLLIDSFTFCCVLMLLICCQNKNKKIKNEKKSRPDVCFAASVLNRLHSTISFACLIIVCLTRALQFAFRFPFFISLLFLHFQEPFSFFLCFLLLLFNMRGWNGQHWWLIIMFWGGKQNRLILFLWWSVLYIFICCLNRVYWTYNLLKLLV